MAKPLDKFLYPCIILLEVYFLKFLSTMRLLERLYWHCKCSVKCLFLAPMFAWTNPVSRLRRAERQTKQPYRRLGMRRGFTNKRCPKCNGNVFVDQEHLIDTEGGYRGWYEWCLQCGHTRYLQPTTNLMEEFKVIPATKELALV